MVLSEILDCIKVWQPCRTLRLTAALSEVLDYIKFWQPCRARRLTTALSRVFNYIKRANGTATDFSHILYGFITAVVPDLAVKAIMIAVYFAYQAMEALMRSKKGEHYEKEMDELIGDMREFMVGFAMGIITKYGLEVPF